MHPQNESKRFVERIQRNSSIRNAEKHVIFCLIANDCNYWNVKDVGSNVPSKNKILEIGSDDSARKDFV